LILPEILYKFLMNLVECVQYMALIIACFCGLIFTVLQETESGHAYTAMFLGLCMGWLGIFAILLCIEKCTREESEDSEESEYFLPV
jgi:hypothetical protein